MLVRAVLLSVCLLVPSFAGIAHAEDGEVLVDRIAAIVDGHPILLSEVQQKVVKGPLVAVSDYPADESSAPYERALQDSINFELVMAKAKYLEIDVRDDEVDQEIKSFLEKRNVSRDDLDEHLAAAGQSYEDYRDDFKDQMVLRRFQGRVIAPLVKITDKDIETYYLKKAGSTSELVELVLRQILISVSATASDNVVQEKRKLAQEVHQRIVDGTSFPEAVKVYSDEASARENGGLMAPVKTRDLAPTIRAEVENLEVGKFTLPVRTSLGFHIFYLEEKRFAGSQEFQTKKNELEFELRNLELANQTRRWLTEQRQRSKVEIVAE